MAPRGCIASAYRNGGSGILGVLPAVFPDCPPFELMTPELVCPNGGCTRPCAVKVVSTSAKGDTYARKSTFTHDKSGRLVRLAESSSSVQTWEYDDAGRVVRWKRSQDPSDEPPVTVTRDGFGAITVLADGVDTWSFTYDPSGRVTKLGYAGGSFELTYDDAGHVVGEKSGILEASFGYDAQGRLASRKSDSGEETLSYDARGRLEKIARPKPYRETVFAYDAKDRLITKTEDEVPAGGSKTVSTFDYCGS
jgi:YD repeat-containing protein